MTGLSVSFRRPAMWSSVVPLWTELRQMDGHFGEVQSFVWRPTSGTVIRDPCMTSCRGSALKNGQSEGWVSKFPTATELSW